MSIRSVDLARLRDLCERSRILWDAAVDSAVSEDAAATREARAEAMTEWEGALVCLSRGDVRGARQAMSVAALLAADYGDDNIERRAAAIINAE